MAGTFITLEGPDGMGKTTVLQALRPRLTAMTTQPVIETREPGGSQIAEEIRGVLLDVKNTKMDERTEALLFAAARRQHLVEVVLPALKANKIIFSDRFVDSSVAYQGAGRQIGEKAVYDLNLFATEDLLPDLTLLLDGPVEVGLARINQHRQNQSDRLDQETLAFHQRVRQGYRHLAQEFPERIKIIDGTQPLETVVENCFQQITRQLPEVFKGRSK